MAFIPRTLPKPLTRYATLVSFAALACLATGFGSRNLWLCDLLANLRLHLLAGLLLLLLYHVVAGQKRLSIAVALCLAVTVIANGPVGSTRTAGDTSTAATLGVVSFNLGHGYQERSAVTDYLKALDADVLIFLEYSPAWHAHLKAELGRYAFAVAEPMENAFGIAIYSKVALAGTRVLRFPASNIPYIRGSIATSAGPLDLLALHVQWPMTPSTFKHRNRQIETIAALAADSENPFVACGDWNMTPWSGWYRFLRETGLHDGPSTHTLAASWPAGLGPAGISIDHCFATRGARIHRRQPGPALGPDHRPIVVRLTVAAAAD